MDAVSFDVEGLLDEARGATGLSDFGPPDFRPGLEQLLRTYSENPLNDKRRQRGRERLLQLVTTRLRVAEAFRVHPEIRERRIIRPLVVTGMPRSGTSAQFNLLAADPAARPLLMWETQFPDPCEGLAPGVSDPRREAVEARFARGRANNPEFTKIHYVSADTPEECGLLHALAMNGVQMGTEIFLEPYASWYRQQDLHAMYAYQADLLRLLDWQRRPGERWTLKSPAHMWGIDALIDTFPDVDIVWSHRDPLACIASICSMTFTMMKTQLDVDPAELGPRVMDFYATSLERGLEARDARDLARFVDIAHDEFVEDPLKLAERIYSHFGRSLGDETRAAFEAQVAAHPRGRHGRHDYDLEPFGLTADGVRERFASYIERFDLAQA